MTERERASGVQRASTPEPSAATTTISRKRLGDILVEAGLVTRSQLEATLVKQRSDPRRLGVLLVEAGFLTPARLSQTLSHQLCLPWVSLANLPVSADLVELVPAEIALAAHVLPVHVTSGLRGRDVLYVATDDPTHEEALATCAAAVGMRVRAVVAAPDDLDAALAKHYGGAAEPPAPTSAVAADPMGAAMAAVARRPPSLPPRPPVELDEVDPDDVELVDVHSDPPPSARRLVVMVVKPPRALLRECRLAASPLGVFVVVADLGELRAKVNELAPLAIVVTDELYAFDRVAFSTLALETGSPLVIWSDELDAAFLEPVFATAVRRATMNA